MIPRCTFSLTRSVLGQCLSLLAILSATNGMAQQQQSGSLQNDANDPTASVMSFQFQDFYTRSHYNSGASSNPLQSRSATPFRLWDLNHIARLTLPYSTNAANSASGFRDISLFDLATFDRSWVRFGVGAVSLLPTDADRLSAG